MTFYRINSIIPYAKGKYPGNISDFVTQLVKGNTHYFLYLRVEIKPGYIKITGYSLSSLFDTSNSNLWLYLNNGINTFIDDIYTNYLNEVENYKDVLYISCFGKIMSTYY